MATVFARVCACFVILVCSDVLPYGCRGEELNSKISNTDNPEESLDLVKNLGIAFKGFVWKATSALEDKCKEINSTLCYMFIFDLYVLDYLSNVMMPNTIFPSGSDGGLNITAHGLETALDDAENYFKNDTNTDDVYFKDKPDDVREIFKTMSWLSKELIWQCLSKLEDQCIHKNIAICKRLISRLYKYDSLLDVFLLWVIFKPDPEDLIQIAKKIVKYTRPTIHIF